MSVFQKLAAIPKVPLFLLCLLAMLGMLMLVSAANGSIYPWAFKQLIRFSFGFIVMLCVTCIDVRILFLYAYPLYLISFVALIAVEFMGFVGMGAQRWIDLYVFNFQPSEMMRLGLILTLARYFHGLNDDETINPMSLIIPIVLILAPTLLVLRQPDLGTAMLLMLSSAAIFFTAGVRLWKFAIVGGAVFTAIPLLWPMLHEYQKKRIMIFINPESDPTHAGYHIIQSKIALGSGGIFGKGFLQGTQSHLNFLPEKQTDFIFTMFCEEFGLIGAVLLILLYMTIIAYNIRIALNARTPFSRLAGLGLTVTLFLYVFINMAMVTGLLPVVGIPLPLFSYGGTAMLTLLISQGILYSIHIHNDTRIRL
ncbi:MAG: rod shape-determining protein RodA [Candidatus Paracaedibacteraceae bacterium]|nr:rod shape-determining protein RodA [Candidatus Paracaedibacteraceae bacterium]